MIDRKLGKKAKKESGTFIAYACNYSCYCYCSSCKNCNYTTAEADGRAITSYVNNSKNNSDAAVITLLG